MNAFEAWLDGLRRGYNRLPHAIITFTLCLFILIIASGCTDVHVDLTNSTVEVSYECEESD